jgi:hypothetical protein
MRACLVAVALVLAACSSATKRDVMDGAVADPPPGCRPSPSGIVQVVSSNLSMRTDLAAAFAATPGGGTCSDMTMGSCVASTSTQGPGMLPHLGGAGTITVGGGATMLTAMPMTNPTDGSTSYESVTAMQPLWQGGELITVAASGGSDVPAFSTTLAAPAQATVTMPARPAGGAPLVQLRQSDLALAWSGEGYGTVDAVMASLNVYVHCRWPVAAHGGAIPAAMLAMLPASTSLSVTRQSEQQRVEGAWSIDVILASGSVDDAGGLASYDVTLQ